MLLDLCVRFSNDYECTQKCRLSFVEAALSRKHDAESNQWSKQTMMHSVIYTFLNFYRMYENFFGLSQAISIAEIYSQIGERPYNKGPPRFLPPVIRPRGARDQNNAVGLPRVWLTPA